MKYVHSKFVLACALLATIAVAPARPAVAQEMKTMAVVSLSGYDNLVGDVNYIGKLVGREGLSQILEGGIAAFTQGKGLAGLDKTKPWGVLVQTNGAEFEPLVCLPVTDLKGLLDALAGAIGPAQEGDGGIYELQAGPQAAYVKAQGAWAFVARNSDMLKNPPADPTQLLDGLNETYDIGVRLYVQQVPEMFRQMAIDQIKAGIEQGLEREEGEDDEAFELRQRLARSSMDNLVTMINETDQVTLGWLVDPSNKSTYLDTTVTGIAGGKFARQAAQLVNLKSEFGGFYLPDAAVTATLTSKGAEQDDIDRALEMIDAFTIRAMKAIDEDSDLPDDASREKVKSAVQDLVDVAKGTIKEGLMDGGMVIRMEPEKVMLATGGRVSDGAGVEKAMKKLAELAENEPGIEGVKWNAAEHAGIRFHTVAVPVPDEQARQALGDKLDVALGIGAKQVYLAIGKGSLEALKGIIDGSQASAAEEVLPLRASISVSKILQFAAAQENDPNIAALAEMVGQGGGDDHVKITARAVENGATYRFELEEGVIKVLGMLGMMK